MKGAHWPLVLAAVAAACVGGDETSPYDWRKDDRLRVTLSLSDGPPKGHFDRDTGDMLPAMVEKMATGKSRVQNHYRGELAGSGPRCVSLIEDLIQRHSGSPNSTLVIGTALGVLGLSEDPSAVVVVRKMLGHPAESVRSAAIRAMARLAEPGDYDVLKELMPIVSGEIRRVLVQALGRADPGRLGDDLSRWITEGEDAAILTLAARAVADGGAGAALHAGVLQAEAASHPNVQPFIAAAMASAGDADATAMLAGMMTDVNELVRTRAVEAASMADLEHMLMGVAADDPSEILRVLATQSISRLLPDEEVLERLRAGVHDESGQVRQASLSALLAHGDEAVGDHFISLLDAGPSELGPAFRAVRGHWDMSPGLASRCAGALIETLDGMKSRSLREREPWVQALGQVPSEEGARWLIGLAGEVDGENHQLSAHRWVVLQCSNGGPGSRRALMDAWAVESDAEKRLDFLWGASFSREADAIELLIEVAMSSEAADHERLYAADCLTRLGVTERVAPLLKRACLEITDPDVRPAFEGLLWLWYG